MNTRIVNCTPPARRHRAGIWSLAAAAMISATAFAGAAQAGAAQAEDAAPASAPAAGSWQSHKYSFQYMGFTSTYSCDGLADKLKKLLLAAGARSDVKSQPGACASGFGRPDKFARADLTFYTLTPAAGADDAADGKQAKGLWRPVAISDRSPRELQVGDCELIEQFKNLVLPMFTTRNVVNNTTCVPHQESGSMIDLKFDAFAAIPAVKGAPPGNGG